MPRSLDDRSNNTEERGQLHGLKDGKERGDGTIRLVVGIVASSHGRKESTLLRF